MYKSKIVVVILSSIAGGTVLYKCLVLDYRRIELSGAHRYLVHTAYLAHAVFLTKSV